MSMAFENEVTMDEERKHELQNNVVDIDEQAESAAECEHDGTIETDFGGNIDEFDIEEAVNNL